MRRASLTVVGFGAALLAACSTAPEEVDAATGTFARAPPSQELFVLPPMIARERAADGKEGAYEFAESLTISATPSTAGIWDSPSPGLRRWRLTIERAGSLSQSFGFTRYRMPRAGLLRLLDATGHEVAAFTDRHNKPHGELWTPIARGERATIEVTLPAELVEHLDLALTEVSSAFRGFEPGVQRSGSCNRDVVCGEGDAWSREIRSVAMIALRGTKICSATLLNDTAGDWRPFLLTARHCGVSASNAASLVVYWNYETTACGATPDGRLDHFQTGSTFRASNAASDFTLLELDDVPDPAFEVVWSGWDARPIVPAHGVGIHHPRSEEKRISFENDPLTVTTYTQDASPGDGTHLRVADWDVGTTESGSSGSGLWNPEHRLVGQLHGGAAACGNDRPDWYGSFTTTWNAGASAAERAKDWLDQAGTGASFADGKEGCASPRVEFSTTPNPAAIGQPVTALATVSGGTGPHTYAWDMDGDGRTDCTGPECTFTFGQESAGNVELAVVDSTGCRASVVRHQQVVVDPGLCAYGFDSSDVPKVVPDHVVEGISSAIDVTTHGTVEKAKISLRIEHMFITDLRVSLVSPGGREVPIHQNTGGATQNLVLTDLELPSLLGEPLAGTWSLKVADTRAPDAGRLVSWKLAFRTQCARTR